ncbi:MAG TPA: hypothetical protein VMF91_05015 [Bryobacteraceae bacterium]|nr:hypothetical protein [Bryobacteraceae bacterium]
MKSHFRAYVAALALAAISLAGKQAQQTGPHPKSQKEVDALKKVQADQQAKNWDAEMTDINYVLENFADTEYKSMLLDMAIQAAQNKGDYAQTVAFAEQAVQADPNNVEAYVKLAETIALHTRENDLDKDTSLKKVDTDAHKALDLLKTASTPPTGITADQWPTYKKQLEGQAHDAMGMADDIAKKFPESIEEYKAAIAVYPNPIILTHMAKAQIDAKQFDDAIATDDKVLAMSDAPADVKQFAQNQKDSATKMKGATGTAQPK